MCNCTAPTTTFWSWISRNQSTLMATWRIAYYIMLSDLCTHIKTSDFSELVTRIVGLHRPVNLHVRQIALCGQDWDIVKMNIGEWISRSPEKIISTSCNQEIGYTYTWRKVASGRQWPWDPEGQTPCFSQIGRWHVLVDMMHNQRKPSHSMTRINLLRGLQNLPNWRHLIELKWWMQASLNHYQEAS